MPSDRGRPAGSGSTARSAAGSTDQHAPSIVGVAEPEVLHGPLPHGMRRSILRLLERLADLGARPEDTHDERLRQGTLIFSSLLITVISTVWVPTYLAYGDPSRRRSRLLPGDHGRRAGRAGPDAAFRHVPHHAARGVPGAAGIAAGLARRLRGLERDDPVGGVHPAGGARAARSPALRPWLVAFFVELGVLALLDPRLLAQSPAALPTGFVVTFFVLNVIGRHGERLRDARLLRGAAGAGPPRRSRPSGSVRSGCCSTCCPSRSPSGSRPRPGVIAEHYDAVSVLFADIVGLHRAVGGHGAGGARGAAGPGVLRVRPARRRRRASRRSRRSATRTWWWAGCRSRGRTTSRRSPARRSRCATRSPRSPASSGRAGSPSGSGSTPGRWSPA